MAIDGERARDSVGVAHEVGRGIEDYASMAMSGIGVGEDSAILFITFFPAEISNEIVYHISPMARTIIGMWGVVHPSASSEIVSVFTTLPTFTRIIVAVGEDAGESNRQRSERLEGNGWIRERSRS